MQQLPCLGVIKYMNCRKSLAALVLAAVLAVTGCGAAEGAGGGAKTNTEAESGSGAKTNVKAQEKDIHERDTDYLHRCHAAYLELADKYKWDKVICNAGENPRSIDAIHQDVYALVEQMLKK